VTNIFARTCKQILSRIASPEELNALRTLISEISISARHRRGLSKVKRDSLARPKKINLGCGRRPKPDFLNVDIFPDGDVTLDLRRTLPFESNCCDLIYSEHCFEHFEYPKQISGLLAECLRVLKNGGELRLSVPDAEWPLNDYAVGIGASYFKACNQERWHPKYCTTRLEHINYHFRQGTEHRYAYDFETAEKMLSIAGFVDIKRREFDDSIDSKRRELGSLLMSARKPCSPASLLNETFGVDWC